MDGRDGLQIDVAALRTLLDEGRPVALLDVREAWEHEICRIENSALIPLGQLAGRTGELDGPEDGGEPAPLVVICHHGMRSMQATLWLRQQGFANAVNLAGGIDAWASRIDPSMQRY